MMCRRRVRENKEEEEEEKMNMNMNVYHNKKFCMLCLVLAFGFAFPLFFVVEIYAALESTDGTYSQELIFSKNNLSATSTTTINRKLLSFPDIGGSVNRMGAPCSKESIYLFQGPTSPLPNGIPTYTVQIENVCVSGECSISNIHLSCGWFSSARLINPNIFRRIYYDDCLVNNGEPLNPGESLSFQYANSFQYPMSVSSVTCY